VVALDLPPEAQQQLEAQKDNLGAAHVPKGLSGETAAAVQKAIEESFVAGFRIAMFVAAALALASAVAAGIMVEGKGGRKIRGSQAKRRRNGARLERKLDVKKVLPRLHACRSDPGRGLHII
jgi:hypothetical protein